MKELYQCDLCKHIYDTPDEAIACEAQGVKVPLPEGTKVWIISYLGDFEARFTGGATQEGHEHAYELLDDDECVSSVEIEHNCDSAYVGDEEPPSWSYDPAFLAKEEHFFAVRQDGVFTILDEKEKENLDMELLDFLFEVSDSYLEDMGRSNIILWSKATKVDPLFLGWFKRAMKVERELYTQFCWATQNVGKALPDVPDSEKDGYLQWALKRLPLDHIDRFDYQTYLETKE